MRNSQYQRSQKWLQPTLPVALLLLAACCHLAGAGPAAKSIDQVLAEYVQASGGAEAIDRIQTREVDARRRHGSKLTYLWQHPNKVLLRDGKKTIGYDGGSGWTMSSKKRVSKLPKGQGQPLQMVANPLRYTALKRLYPDVVAAQPVQLEERTMDVLESANHLGSTRFYFDSSSHLLARVEETGETSAYFKTVTDLSDYQQVDGIKLPFRIVHRSTEPGVKPEEIQISKVMQNVPVRPEIFNKPAGAAVVLGGKR